MNSKSKYNPQIHHRRSIRLKGYDYSQAGAYFITICCQDRLRRFGNIVDGEMILNEFGQIAFDEWVKLPERFANMELDVFVVMPNHFHGIVVLNNVGVGTIRAGVNPAPTIGSNDTTENNVGVGLAPAQNDNAEGNVEAGVNQNNDTNKIRTGVSGAGVREAGARETDVREAGASAAGVRGTGVRGTGASPADVRGAGVREAGASPADVRGAGVRGAGASPAPTGNDGMTGTIGDIVGAYKSLVANACLDIYKSRNETMGKLWQRNYYEHIIRNEKSFLSISEYIINNPGNWENDTFYSGLQ